MKLTQHRIQQLLGLFTSNGDLGNRNEVVS